MNKKSMILSFLLCIGLLTPQETKPFFGTALIIASAVYGTILLNTLGVPLNPFRTKNQITDYTKEQLAIKTYKAHIEIIENKTKKILLDTKINAITTESFIKSVLEKTESFANQKNVKFTISSTVTLHDNQECILKKISTKKISKKTLTNKLEQLLLVKKNQRSTLSYVAYGTFLTLASMLVIVPIVTEVFISGSLAYVLKPY